MSRSLPVEKPSRAVAIAEDGLAMLIWASSFVLVKMGLAYVGPLTLAGLRYFLAFLLLFPFMLQNGKAAYSWPSRLWLRLYLIGLSAYALGNGALFWGLKYLPATTGSFLLNLVPLLILFLGIVWLHELPTRWQIVGVVVGLVGSVLFFSPGLRGGEPLGIGIVLAGLAGFAAFGILGRAWPANRK
jgi:drug/metabolite transporter (DMT)-like permease